jgi:hypothetical protein
VNRIRRSWRGIDVRFPNFASRPVGTEKTGLLVRAAPFHFAGKANYIFLAESAFGAAIAVLSFFMLSAIAGAAVVGAAASGAGAAAGAAAAESIFGVSSVFAAHAARESMATNVAIRFIGISPGISKVMTN